ncbi:uncharacterized protein LOC120150946 [Hibiscus syriacus]|uniref:uncharacterized protein LOC120150946 n=1 Tax=Hibiscus syriacus TaxID=106335 RepID=UPI001920ADA0|nr:uncharacterized protein LOC120150946 [Hibiscus syriacus]
MVITHRYMHLEDITAEGKMEGVDSVYKDPLIPLFNATREERIAWFEMELQKLEYFKSRNSNSKFHNQVSGFDDSICSVQYFMVWLSPAQSFGVREFSAVHSLFKASPKGRLMILSPSLDSRQGDQILKPLIDGGFKVLAATPDFTFLLKNTPSESWFNELKSDFIVLKDFIRLRNAIGAQSISTINKKWTRINGAAMIFDEGHPILYDFLEEFAVTFDGSKWGHNGPCLISRVIQRVEKNLVITSQSCHLKPFIQWVGSK